MVFKLIGGNLDTSAEAREAFSRSFLFTDAHLDLLGRVYGKLIVAVDDLDVPMRRIVEEQRIALRHTYAYRLLGLSDRDCIEWIFDRAVAGGQAPSRPRPAMVDGVCTTTRAAEAIAVLCDAISNAAPGWRWRLIDATETQLSCEPAYLRMCGEGQLAVAPFLNDKFDPVRTVERERGR